MDWLISWLQTQLTFWQACYFILVCAAIDLVWSVGVCKIFHFLRVEFSQNTANFTSRQILRRSFFPHIAYAAAKEELVYRIVPLSWSVTCLGITPTLWIALILSIIFGLIHGNAYNILLQGVGGIVYSIIFLKCGGLGHHFVQASLCVVVAHCLHNSLEAVLVVLHDKLKGGWIRENVRHNQ
jgi:predicted Abi (CAAX) family protease